LTQEEFENREPAPDTDSGEEYAHDGDSESNDDSDDDVELDEWIISRTRRNRNTVARTSQQAQEHPTHETDDPNVVTDNSADQGQASDDDDPGGSPNGYSDMSPAGGPSKLSVSGGSSIASSPTANPPRACTINADTYGKSQENASQESRLVRHTDATRGNVKRRLICLEDCRPNQNRHAQGSWNVGTCSMPTTDSFTTRQNGT
jgi:hypothetical protein